MEIRTFSEGARLEESRRVLLEMPQVRDFGFSRLHLLPIPSTRDKKTVTGTAIPLAELENLVESGDAVAGYGIPENIKAVLSERGAFVYDASGDEEFLLRNAEITARGALGYILTEYGRDVTDLNIGIVGYGRIGACLLRYLLFLGAPVTLYTTRVSVAMELNCAGVCASSDFDGVGSLDLLVNTAPARLLKPGEIRTLLSHGRLLDLASGNIFDEGEGVVRLPSIPEKFYPKTAGKIYAEQIARHLSEATLC